MSSATPAGCAPKTAESNQRAHDRVRRERKSATGVVTTVRSHRPGWVEGVSPSGLPDTASDLQHNNVRYERQPSCSNPQMLLKL
jgi:hypothetical protein